jgi:hypothetical protein
MNVVKMRENETLATMRLLKAHEEKSFSRRWTLWKRAMDWKQGVNRIQQEWLQMLTSGAVAIFWTQATWPGPRPSFERL